MGLPPTPSPAPSPPDALRMVEVDVQLAPGQPTTPVAVPANSPEEAFWLLHEIGNGTTGSLAHATVLQVLRDRYKAQLMQVETEIMRRRAMLGANPTEYELRGLAQWGARQRANTARSFRIPTPAVGIGLEVRDWRTYGVGGRTWDNLVRRQAARGKTGAAAYEALIGSATRSNADVNAKMARGARFLRTGGGVLAVAGVGLSAWDVYQAPEGQRGAVATRHAVGFAGGLIGAEVGVGLLTIGAGLLLASPPGWIVLAVGLVGGVAGSVIADRIFYPEDHAPAARRMAAGAVVDPARPGVGAGSDGRPLSTSLPIITRVQIVVAPGDTQASLSRRAYLQAAASAGLSPAQQASFAERHAAPAGLSWVAGDPSPGTAPAVSAADLGATAGRPVIFSLNGSQRAELAGLQLQN